MTPDDPSDSSEDDPTTRHRDGARRDIPQPRDTVPASERNTGTYAGSPEFVAGHESGFEAGFKAGVDKATAALRAELTRAGATNEEIARVIARIRSVATGGR